MLAGRKQLDDVVRSVDEVATGDGIDGLLARLFAHGATPPSEPGSSPVPPPRTACIPIRSRFSATP